MSPKPHPGIFASLKRNIVLSFLKNISSLTDNFEFKVWEVSRVAPVHSPVGVGHFCGWCYHSLHPMARIPLLNAFWLRHIDVPSHFFARDGSRSL